MKPVWFFLAWFFFVLGIIGALVPVLPTTPFLLLSAYFFSRSSPRFHRWLLELPVAGRGIRDWQENRVIRPRAKVLCATMIGASIFFIFRSHEIHIALKGTLVLILLLVVSFVLTRKSHPNQHQDNRHHQSNP